MKNMMREASLQAMFSGMNPRDVNLKPKTKQRTRNRRCRSVVGRRSRPQTPLFKWNMEEDGGGVEEELEDKEASGEGRRRKGTSTVPARKLAAGLWRLQLPETAIPGGGERKRGQLGIKGGNDFTGVPVLHEDEIHGSTAKDLLRSPASVFGTENGLLHKIESSIPYLNSAMEGATKWDLVCLKPTNEVRQTYSRMKHIDQRVTAVSTVSALEAELEQARVRTDELETECWSSKKKLEHLLRKVSEERAEWRSREHEKIRVFVDDVKANLNREKKNRQRLEIVNSKLVNELAAAKLSAKQYMQNYEKERKSRELIEEACDELAKEIGEDKAEVEALRRYSIKLRKVVDEERKMLQMVEVWREERVQMKLIDAKVALEKRYSQMNKLVADLENFLRSRTETRDANDMREAESLRQGAASVNVQEIKEFTYEPQNPDDIFAVFEEVASAEATETDIEPCVAYSSILRHSNANVEIEEDESGWETVSDVEYQSSSYSQQGSTASVNKNPWHSYFSGSGTEWEDNTCRDTPTTEFSEVCSLPARQFKKVSSMAKLWRSCPNNGEKYKTISVEGTNCRPSTGRKSNWSIMSLDKWSVKGGFSPSEMLGQWSSPDSTHPPVTKRCSEWSCSAQPTSLKAKLLEARTETQKVQLRHVLKEEI
ncbi:hypothetical protein GOBAR_DD24152 [Gossypium barbadense]|nr:hypothetical protein GOBAR_DD24152 [Gossypium barbadense]